MVLSASWSVAVIGLIGAISGRNALRQVESERLIELRESQQRQVEALFQRGDEFADRLQRRIQRCRGNEARSPRVSINWPTRPSLPPSRQAIVNYYNNDMIKPIKQLTGDEHRYQRGSAEFQRAEVPSGELHRRPEADARLDACRRTPATAAPWSAANARFDFYMRDIVTRFDYRDALLLDTQGNVVYTVNKGPDLGTNILTGPYRESNLRDAYQKALRSNDVDFVWITDFQPYQPQLDAPTAWVVSPVGMNGKIDGVMALPLPIAKDQQDHDRRQTMAIRRHGRSDRDLSGRPRQFDAF